MFSNYSYRSRLEEENECNEQFIAKEKLIHLYLSAAVAERTDAQCNKIADAHSDEVVQAYNSNLKKIQNVSLVQCFSHFSLTEYQIIINI